MCRRVCERESKGMTIVKTLAAGTSVTSHPPNAGAG